MKRKTIQRIANPFMRIWTTVYQTLLLMKILGFLSLTTIHAQEQSPSKQMFRIYLDNDFFAYRKEDGGYSSGVRMDLFYQRSSERESFFSNFLIKAGDNAINTHSWSIMQVMITSNDITKEEWAEGDYPYSGSLFISRALHSINSEKQYSIKTEWLAGIMGPKAYAGETQTWFHDLMGYPKPMGWHHQMPTSVLFNLNLSIEKLIFSPSKNLEVSIGGEVDAGTLYNGVSFQSTIRIGRMMPYFSGYLNRFTSDRGLQAYFILKPQVSIVFHNTLLEGSLFRDDYSASSSTEGKTISESESNTLIAGIDYGIVLSYGPVAFSFTLNTNSGLVRNQPPKLLGNMSLYFAL